MYIYVTMHLDFTICLVLITGVARDGRCPKYQDMDGKCLGNYVFQDRYILSYYMKQYEVQFRTSHMLKIINGL